MATVASENQVQELYIAYFGRPADPAGLAFYADALDAGTTTVADIATSFGTSEEAASIVALSTDDYLAAVYMQAFGRAYDNDPAVDGTFWADAINNGETTKELAMIQILDGAQGDDVAAVNNKVAVASTFTAGVESEEKDYASDDIDAAKAVITGVTSDDATVATGNAAADAAVAALDDAVPPVDPGVEGSTIFLTASTDRGGEFNGTADNDQFNAYIEQNAFAGGVSNSISSADVLDGGAGTDSLYAEIVPEFFGATGDNQVDIQPRTSNIERVTLEARDSGSNDVNNNDTVTVDAKYMTDIDEIGSYMSDGDLVIENLTTAQSEGEDRNTEELTITMDHTDNFNSDDDASDLTVYFDEDYLLVGQSTTASQANYWLLDENTLDYTNTPLENIERNGVSLTIDGVAFDINMEDAVAATKDDWDSFAAGLQDVITARVAAGETALENLTVVVDLDNTDSTFNDQGVEVTIPAITIIDSAGRALVPTGFTSPEEQTAGFDIYGTFDNVASTTEDNLLAVGVDLHKVGREGEGGDLVVGGKELDQDGGVQNQGNGIGIFNIDVLGDESKLSNLGGINSTNNALTTVNIATHADYVSGSSFASLTVRDAFDASTAMATVNANAFLGDLNIGQDDAALNVNTFTATGGGDVTYNADISGIERAAFTNTTGEGNDTITVTLDGDAVDTVGTSFAVNAGNGNNTVTVTMAEGGVSVATTALLNNLSIASGSGVDKITVNGGSTGTTDGDGDFTVTSGAGSDMVHIRSVGDPGSVAVAQTGTITLAGTDDDGAAETLVTTITDAGGTTTFTTQVLANGTFSDAGTNISVAPATATGAPNSTYTVTEAAGVVTIVANTAGVAYTVATAASSGDDITAGAYVPTGSADVGPAATGTWTTGDLDGTGATTFVGRVLYEAELTVNFAGFEETVTVETDAAGNFVASQLDINNAIIDAIASNVELSKLLVVTQSTGSQQLIITSTVEGDNDLAIDLFQPELVANGAVAPQVNFSSSDLAAVQAGLLATTANNSDATDTVAEVIAILNGIDQNLEETGVVGSAYDVLETGDGTDGTDEAVVTNVSSIDMGTGTNDLVVLNSDDDSANTMVFSAGWGKVSVVNFFTDKALAQTNAAALADDLVEGAHIIDFTAWLDDQTDPSATPDTLSAVRVATTDVVAAAGGDLDLDSNEVVIVNDWTQNTGAAETFAAMNAANIAAALTGTEDYGTNAIVASSATATASLVGTTQDSILMIENDLNAGEYKVFNVETTGAGATEAFDVTLIGTIDFGGEIDAGAVFA